MKEEYNYTLTVPITDIDEAEALLAEVQADNPRMRLSRKPDRGECARFYLCFPFAGSRTDLKFHEWFTAQNREGWDLFGPKYGVWGLV
ncbi:MAG: hypothetical protein ACN4GW_01580 [Desulforhopalus sp.]